jgi:ApbE superfamily uncharacterized protein (UPF0280 family)
MLLVKKLAADAAATAIANSWLVLLSTAGKPACHQVADTTEQRLNSCLLSQPSLQHNRM